MLPGEARRTAAAEGKVVEEESDPGKKIPELFEEFYRARDEEKGGRR